MKRGGMLAAWRQSLGSIHLRSLSTTLHGLRETAFRKKQEFLAAPLHGQVFVVLLGSGLVLYLLTAFFGGGDAFYGHRTGDRFFFAHHDGAPEHEVSQFIYYLNLWDMALLAALCAIGMCVGVYDLLKEKLRSGSN